MPAGTIPVIDGPGFTTTGLDVPAVSVTFEVTEIDPSKFAVNGRLVPAERASL
jgi:hypothetical protein